MTGRLSDVSKERPSAVRLPRRVLVVVAFAVGCSAYAERALGQEEAPRLSLLQLPGRDAGTRRACKMGMGLLAGGRCTTWPRTKDRPGGRGSGS